MAGKTTKTILILILLIAVIAVSIGYYMYNKGPGNVKNSSSIKINAAELYRSFITDAAVALKTYAGKIVEVKGRVAGTSINQQKEKIVLLSTAADGGNINCTMEEDPGNLQTNDEVVIKGICSGINQGDGELGIKADVYLTRSFIIK
ncbi:hypothetical protein BH11BAC4_BH11BAC4_05480 [soil metagenome]